ncbi:uncharacterized protein FTJAE_1516 [Fusarium tjaetaba]|uniref:Uncharacterized protein n=1 Tax=Fusarium tjaetaba TaxID=1567544 RepID=A0A8H5S9Y7_9HYPO|nr:uncharacterized protein FTJAE_1516 [Fusarium tjaetaba]KAF5647833.1 hypothetical protein FTJAE_1516 [Fusarium tjaetaba]
MPDFTGLELTGKAAIVTGASRGLGAGIAILLGKQGANVVVNYVSDGSRERAEKVAQEIEANGTKAIVVQADVSQTAEIPKSSFTSKFGSVEGARLGVAGQTVYAATKAADEALVRVWAKELGQSHGITVNCVNPGPIATDQWFQSDEQFLKDMQPLIDSTPAAARVGEVSDIAPLVAFLCTDDAKWTTGSVLSANGGLYN